MLVTYRRSGGPKPRSDELLVIDDSGEVTLRRVVNIDRVGSFHGQVAAGELLPLRKLIDAAAKATVSLQAPSRPPYEIEEMDIGGDSLRFHPAQKLPKAVTNLRDRLLEIGEEALGSPVLAIELRVDPSAGRVRLLAVGERPGELDADEATATYDLFGPDESLLSSGQVALPLPPGPERIVPGWSAEAPLPSMEFAPQNTLQVRVAFRLKFLDGAWRDVQITALAGKGWS